MLYQNYYLMIDLVILFNYFTQVLTETNFVSDFT